MITLQAIMNCVHHFLFLFVLLSTLQWTQATIPTFDCTPCCNSTQLKNMGEHRVYDPVWVPSYWDCHRKCNIDANCISCLIGSWPEGMKYCEEECDVAKMTPIRLKVIRLNPWNSFKTKCRDVHWKAPCWCS